VAYKLTITGPEFTYVGQEVSFRGQLTEDTTPIEGVPIKLYVNGKAVAETVTDEGGNYEFKIKFEEPGTYKVYSEAEIPGVPAIPWKTIGAIIAAAAGVGALVYLKRKRAVT